MSGGWDPAGHARRCATRPAGRSARGPHDGTLANAVAISVLGSVELAVPAAVYSVIMFPAAALFGWAITRSARREAPAEATAR